MEMILDQELNKERSRREELEKELSHERWMRMDLEKKVKELEAQLGRPRL